MTQPLQDVIYRFDTTEQLQGWSPGSSSKYEGALVSTSGLFFVGDNFGGLYRLERSSFLAQLATRRLSTQNYSTGSQVTFGDKHIVYLGDDFIAVSLFPIQATMQCAMDGIANTAGQPMYYGQNATYLNGVAYVSTGVYVPKAPVFADVPGISMDFWFMTQMRCRVRASFSATYSGALPLVVQFKQDGEAEGDHVKTILSLPATASASGSEVISINTEWFDLNVATGGDQSEVMSEDNPYRLVVASGSRVITPASDSWVSFDFQLRQYYKEL